MTEECRGISVDFREIIPHLQLTEQVCVCYIFFQNMSIAPQLQLNKDLFNKPMWADGLRTCVNDYNPFIENTCICEVLFYIKRERKNKRYFKLLT